MPHLFFNSCNYCFCCLDNTGSYFNWTDVHNQATYSNTYNKTSQGSEHSLPPSFKCGVKSVPDFSPVFLFREQFTIIPVNDSTK